MTSTIMKAEVLKQDGRGRVRVPVPRREALLDEFEKSGVSGAKFARLVGIKYATFAGWVLRRRRERGRPARTMPGSAAGPGDAVVSAPVRLFEALVEGGSAVGREPVGGGLLIELPGGSRLVVESPVQLQMAAELVALIAQSARARC
jgi:hypothetical protein